MRCFVIICLVLPARFQPIQNSPVRYPCAPRYCTMSERLDPTLFHSRVPRRSFLTAQNHPMTANDPCPVCHPALDGVSNVDPKSNHCHRAPPRYDSEGNKLAPGNLSCRRRLVFSAPPRTRRPFSPEFTVDPRFSPDQNDSVRYLCPLVPRNSNAALWLPSARAAKRGFFVVPVEPSFHDRHSPHQPNKQVPQFRLRLGFKGFLVEAFLLDLVSLINLVLPSTTHP